VFPHVVSPFACSPSPCPPTHSAGTGATSCMGGGEPPYVGTLGSTHSRIVRYCTLR
jgi:hypothetical protein